MVCCTCNTLCGDVLQVGPEEHVICALSGGVDSTVAATLVHKVGSTMTITACNCEAAMAAQLSRLLQLAVCIHIEPSKGYTPAQQIVPSIKTGAR